MNFFSDVKNYINTQEAARRYGLEIDRYGKALCPFHNDRHPSLYVADDHYYCYACGEHGDVIDLTAQLFDLSLYEAAKKLAYDFGISQDKPRQDLRRKKNEAQQLKENERLCFLRLTEYQRRLQEWKVRYAPCSPEDTPDSRYLEACQQLDYVEHLLDVPMLDFVKEAFLMEKEYQEALGLRCTVTVDGYTDFIFLNRDVGLQRAGTLNKAICRIIRDCNDEILLRDKNATLLLPHFSCHSLWHTFTTRMCEAGVNVKVIQDTLGHADISTTLDIYTDVTKEFKKTEFAGLEIYFANRDKTQVSA